VASKPRIFARLAGLETEYAVSVRPLSNADARRELPPTKLEIYERVLVALSKRLPVVRAYHLKEGAFLATGGAVWFEADRLTGDSGLIEGATPECRRPRDIVAFQQAQDRLLEDAVQQASFDCEIRLLKNDRDAFNNIYGAQESYEAEFATGVWLALWRVGLVLLFPLMIFTWLGMLAMSLAGLAYEYIAAGMIAPLGDLIVPRGWVGRVLLGEDRVQARPFGAPWPAWLESVLLMAERVVCGPLAAALYLLLQVVAFRRVRRKLLPFLISRPIFAGAGMLAGDNRFLLADKGPAMNSVMGFGGFFHGRPIILLGEFYKRLVNDALFAPLDYLDLFHSRQRLQIGIGDSNMCETAQWLRVGTTMLVLDCIEAGEMPDPPRIRHPISALRAVCADTELGHAIGTAQGACTATELQRFYAAACRRFLNRHSHVPREAVELQTCWEQTLDALESNSRSLVGQLDWVTKRFLLESAPHDASHESLKKIDLKYHELSAEGYHRVLSEGLGGKQVVDPQEAERAMRLPPSDSPAALRGRLIREFVSGEEPLAVNWRMVRIGRGVGAKTYRLADYQSEHAERPSTTTDEEPEVHPWQDEESGD
jgi:proteasome accessory factor A